MANHLKREKQIQIINLICEGCSVRSTERITRVHRDTIGRLLLRVGAHCERILAERLTGFECDQLEIDELWGFVGKKQKRVTPDDPGEFGDAYTFIGMCGVSKVVIHHEVGKRDESTTNSFMAELSRRVEGRTHIAVDGFPAYPEAIREWFRNRADAMAVIKNFRTIGDQDQHRYSPGRFTGCIRYAIQGFPRRSRSTTSHVERLNWTCRTFVKRLNRLTAAFSKRLPNLRASVAMTMAWYNFCRIHRSLGMTPGMAAGVTDTIWPIEALLPPL